MNGIKANAQIRVEQDIDLVLNNMKLKIVGQSYDEMLFTTDLRYNYNNANADRIILKDALLITKNLGETGNIKEYQILILKQLVSAVFRSLHGEIGKHPGNTETNNAYREKTCFPKVTQLFREWIISCEQCNRESRIDHSLSRFSLQNTYEHFTAPEDAMENDLVPELPPSRGYKKIVTAMDVFSR